LDGIPGFDPKNDRRHARREVAPDELSRLIDTTRADPGRLRRLTGAERAMLYLTAFATGYRAGELAELTPENFELDGDAPAVVLPARFTKNKKRARQPVPPGLAAQLREFLAGRPKGRLVWPGSWSDKPVKLLRHDLDRAGVPYCVATIDGPRYADFHALRHTYLSALAAAGVGPKELQELARHSDPQLTLGVYTHARPEALGEAVARLPLPGSGQANPLAGLSRSQLEAAVVALSWVVGSLTGRGVDTPRVTPDRESSGDRRGLVRTGGDRRATG
jgi:integrase